MGGGESNAAPWTHFWVAGPRRAEEGAQALQALPSGLPSLRGDQTAH